MISLLVIGMITAAHGTLFPFKKRTKNIQELLILLNLHALFVSTTYNASNFLSVRILTLLVLQKFVIIIFRHAINQWLSNVSTDPVKSLGKNMKPFLGKHFKYFKQPQKMYDRKHIELIPNVTYNYKEFQEPLIGQDK